MTNKQILTKKSTILYSSIQTNCKTFTKSFATQSYHFLLNKQSQYEYDPNTDTFRPKQYNDQSNDSNLYNNQSNQSNNNRNQSNKNNFKDFLKRFLRNLCLLTGGIVWIGVVFVSLFVDVQESEVEISIRQIEDNSRLMAFYDNIPNQKDLYNILHGKEDTTKPIGIPEEKALVFQVTLNYVKEMEVIVEALGKPVQLCGFLVAEKLSELIEVYDTVTKKGNTITKYDNNMSKYEDAKSRDNESANEWKVKCVLDGSKGIGLLTLKFERIGNDDEINKWILKHLRVEKLDKFDNVIYEQYATSKEEGIELNALKY